jgi:hypothetical protein
MTELITHPNEDHADLEEWRLMVQDLEAYTGGLLRLGIENFNSSGVPRILEGSCLDINGSKYKCTSTESVSDSGSPSLNAYNYIYAVPNGDTASFRLLGGDPPGWDYLKAGWYKTIDSKSCRAVAKMYCLGNGYYSKVLLNDYASMYRENLNLSLNPNDLGIPNTGGNQVLTGLINNDLTGNGGFHLPAGVYRYELKGGTGGRGGYQGSNGTPGIGAQGEVKTGIIILNEAAQCFINTGGDGEDGENGKVSSGGGDTFDGGGGGASGGASYVYVAGKYIVAEGGSGGGGCGGNGSSSWGSGGGGGGGGYDVGGDGSSSDGKGGKGGHDFIGGAGGAPGGGGKAGKAGESGRSGNMFTRNYCKKGGDGGDGQTMQSVAYVGPPGGSWAKNSSSGYSRLFQIWEFRR